MTVIIAVCTLILTYTIAILVGVYSATHQYSFGDQFFTVVAYLGLGTPGFLLADLFFFSFLFYFWNFWFFWIVLGLPTIGPLYVEALQRQDMYMAGTVLVFIVMMMLIGNLLADLALVWLDPRIRLD